MGDTLVYLLLLGNSTIEFFYIEAKFLLATYSRVNEKGRCDYTVLLTMAQKCQIGQRVLCPPCTQLPGCVQAVTLG